MRFERIGRSLSEQAIVAMRRNELRGIVQNVENFLTESRIARMSNEEWANFVARIFKRQDKFERQSVAAGVKVLTGSATIDPDARVGTKIKQVVQRVINPDVRVGTAVKPTKSGAIDPDVRIGTTVKQTAQKMIDPDARV